jgi:hypothetical protein
MSSNVASGILTASIEVVIYCPLERLKVYLMTSPTKPTLSDLIRLPRPFAGIIPMWYRSTTSWVTFLLGNYQFQNLLEYTFQTSSLNNAQMFIVGSLTGLLNTLIIMPFDYEKTKQQEHGTTSTSMMKHLRTLRSETKCWQTFLRTVYKGTSIRLAHYTVHGVINVLLLDYLERKYDVK